jgi:hypothetical protein
MSIGPTLQVGAAGGASAGAAGACVVGGAVTGGDAGAEAGEVVVCAVAMNAMLITTPIPHCDTRVKFKFIKVIPPKRS